MKRIFGFSLLVILVSSGCSLRQREIEIKRKLADIQEREQQLILKEQTLDFRDQQLTEREKILDSTSKRLRSDSLYVLYPQMVGTWSVKMQCVETNCPGSAVGDVKNEQWDFKFQDNNVIASAISNNKLVRVYAGNIVNNSIRLTLTQDSSELQGAKMNVKLQRTNDKEMEGQREIIQSSGCRIIYELSLKKQ